MNNFYFLTQHSFSGTFVLPYLWCSLKTYYEENGEHADNWCWKDPFLYEKSEEEIFEELEKDPPDVFGFSVYVWNEFKLDNIARRVKEKYPNCVIVYGGPQQNVKHDQTYFHKKPWVDICLYASAYGELVLTKILDTYPNIDCPNIPAIYYPGIGKLRESGLASFDRRAFQWPGPVFEAQHDHIIDRIVQAKANNEYIQVYFETSRGCPYKCIYCEWGGGINTKVIKKPWNTIVSDLTWLSKVANTAGLDIVDANFGIFKEDVEIAQFIADLHVSNGYPKQVDFDSAKNNPENLLAIRDIFWEHEISDVYTVSVQTVNEEAKKNIDRVDLPLETHVKSINYLKEKYGKCSVYIERIIGLPGETVDTIYKQLDVIYDAGLDIGKSKPVPWVLLPEAPAFAPAMRERFKVKTVNKLFDFNPKLKEGRDTSFPADRIAVLSEAWVNPTIETVVETYSYSKDDWVRMRNIFSWTLAGEVVGLNEFFIKYLKDEHNILPSDLYKLIVDKSYTDSFNIPELDKISKLERQQSYDWLNKESVKDALMDLGSDWPFEIPSQTALGLVMLKNINSFYEMLGKHYADKLNDPKILDLCKYLAQATIDVEYNPDTGRTFTCEYNWKEYFESGNISSGTFTFEVTDYQDREVWWHKQNNKTFRDIAYFSQVLGRMADSPFTHKVSTTLRLVV
jgi:hypothetical protein